MLQKTKKKKLREVSRHFGSLPEEQSDLGTFMVLILSEGSVCSKCM
ncbi:hypothetical protein E2C01_001489 [Portunus trituberculatus]|uniref:Uncharacterized protein n=1 Tax=Portunus trituberculatus TaxID=210409 RepID=A0A5B7CJJ0_PORTR|nr:hypothetical protein [Portunus trituberculatus]